MGLTSEGILYLRVEVIRMNPRLHLPQDCKRPGSFLVLSFILRDVLLHLTIRRGF
jgi:hypothetical protein